MSGRAATRFALVKANSTFKRPCGRSLEDASIAPTRCTSSYDPWIRRSSRPDTQSRCARMRAVTPGSSMLARIFSRAPQRAHASIWMPNTRFRPCAQRSATWRGRPGCSRSRGSRRRPPPRSLPAGSWRTISPRAWTLGAMGMTKELPLQLMHQPVRVIRIYEGPSEVHRSAVGRRIPGSKIRRRTVFRHRRSCPERPCVSSTGSAHRGVRSCSGWDRTSVWIQLIPWGTDRRDPALEADKRRCPSARRRVPQARLCGLALSTTSVARAR